MLLQYGTLEPKKLYRPIKGYIGVSSFVIGIHHTTPRVRRNLEKELVIHRLSERGAISLMGVKDLMFIPEGIYTEQKLAEYFKIVHKDLILTPQKLTIPGKHKISLSENLVSLLHLDTKINNKWFGGTLIREKPESFSYSYDDIAVDIESDIAIDITTDISTDTPTKKSNSMFYLTCDQIDMDANFFNGIPSNIIAEISGYSYKPQHILYIPLNTYCSSHELLSFQLLDRQMNKVTPKSVQLAIINERL
jgi:hypothetical protein